VATERLIVVLDRPDTAGTTAEDAERVLGAEPGVVRVYTSPSLETVYVAYDPARCSVTRLVTTLVRTGFRIARYRQA
jgi:hypothetical protein